MSRPGPHTARSILVIATLALTGCSVNEPAHESQEQSLEPTFAEVETSEPFITEDATPYSIESQDDTTRFEPSEPESTTPSPEPESSDLPEVEITGNYREDLKTIGVETDDDEHFDRMMEIYEGTYCEGSMTDRVERLEYRMTMLSHIQNDDTELPILITEYNCPERMETIEELHMRVQSNG